LIETNFDHAFGFFASLMICPWFLSETKIANF